MLLPKFIYSFTLEAKTLRQGFLPKITFACIHLEKTNSFQLARSTWPAPERNQPIQAYLGSAESGSCPKILITKIPRQPGSCQHKTKLREEKEDYGKKQVSLGQEEKKIKEGRRERASGEQEEETPGCRVRPRRESARGSSGRRWQPQSHAGGWLRGGSKTKIKMIYLAVPKAMGVLLHVATFCSCAGGRPLHQGKAWRKHSESHVCALVQAGDPETKDGRQMVHGGPGPEPGLGVCHLHLREG